MRVAGRKHRHRLWWIAVFLAAASALSAQSMIGKRLEVLKQQNPSHLDYLAVSIFMVQNPWPFCIRYHQVLSWTMK